jgi:hypothetical protein
VVKIVFRVLKEEAEKKRLESNATTNTSFAISCVYRFRKTSVIPVDNSAASMFIRYKNIRTVTSPPLSLSYSFSIPPVIIPISLPYFLLLYVETVQMNIVQHMP